MRQPLLLTGLAAGSLLLNACGSVAGMAPGAPIGVVDSQFANVAVNLDIRQTAVRRLADVEEPEEPIRETADQNTVDDITKLRFTLTEKGSSTPIGEPQEKLIADPADIVRPITLNNLRSGHSYNLLVEAFETYDNDGNPDFRKISIDTQSLTLIEVGSYGYQEIKVNLTLEKKAFSGTAEDPSAFDDIEDGGYDDTTATETIEIGDPIDRGY